MSCIVESGRRILLRLRRLFHRRVRLLIATIAVVVFLAVLVRTFTSSKGITVDIRLNTNGVATVLGIPLGNGSARDFTLRALSKGHVPVRVLVPSGGSTAPGWDTNVNQTLKAIMKAGLIPTNVPAGPNPFE